MQICDRPFEIIVSSDGIAWAQQMETSPTLMSVMRHQAPFVMLIRHCCTMPQSQTAEALIEGHNFKLLSYLDMM